MAPDVLIYRAEESAKMLLLHYNETNVATSNVQRCFSLNSDRDKRFWSVKPVWIIFHPKFKRKKDQIKPGFRTIFPLYY